ncbi:MAG: HEPN domain-containing protein [Planctomycetes bacterium]|nr:HEPN domain-containing protein [Planctomycetota bacterium]
MPPDPLVVQETRAWLAKADEDLSASELCPHARRSLPATATYHAQQAAEKVIKAWLTWHGLTFRKTHHLIEIAEPSLALDPTLREPLQAALVLSQYAWKHRYPGEWAAPSKAEATEALTLAQRLYRAILDRLPSDVAPG